MNIISQPAENAEEKGDLQKQSQDHKSGPSKNDPEKASRSRLWFHVFHIFQQ